MILTIMVLWAQLLSIGSPDGFDAKMQEYNLVDIQTLNEDILIDLKYSSCDNFVGKDMYGDLERAYLEYNFALKVAEAQRILQEQYPQYSLLIYDAARPISVQRVMRRTVEGTEYESFVADGSLGGRHNYGVAVDLTIATLDGTPIDMGAGFDDFTQAASVKGTPDSCDPQSRSLDVYYSYMMDMVRRGVVSLEAANNRMLLIGIMHKVGLYPYRREWWHFEELTSISDTRKKYKLLDF